MMKAPPLSLETELAPFGFKAVKMPNTAHLCRSVLKLQTLNINRAVAVIDLVSVPDDPLPLLKQIKKEVALRCGFFPVFYGIGIQVVFVLDHLPPAKIEAERYVDSFDNQWSIIQSVFFVHPASGLVATARTWGQRITGKFQDAIDAALIKKSTINAAG